MNKNIGKIDSITRVILGIVIIAYGIMTSSWLGVIGAIPLVTGLIGWCPIYTFLKINTCCKNSCDKK